MGSRSRQGSLYACRYKYAVSVTLREKEALFVNCCKLSTLVILQIKMLKHILYLSAIYSQLVYNKPIINHCHGKNKQLNYYVLMITYTSHIIIYIYIVANSCINDHRQKLSSKL